MNNYINYKDYNDYELIYLIKEGNESALNFFFEKYEKYIIKVVGSYIHYDEGLKEDYIQEGRIILYECIYRYDEDSNVSFFSYFTIILKRKLLKLIQSEMKFKYILCEDILIDYFPKKKQRRLEGKYFFDDELKIKLFDQCIIGGIPLKDFADKNNIEYNKLYYIYQKMLEDLKRFFNIQIKIIIDTNYNLNYNNHRP